MANLRTLFSSKFICELFLKDISVNKQVIYNRFSQNYYLICLNSLFYVYLTQRTFLLSVFSFGQNGVFFGFNRKGKWLFWPVPVLAKMKKSVSVIHYIKLATYFEYMDGRWGLLFLLLQNHNLCPLYTICKLFELLKMFQQNFYREYFEMYCIFSYVDLPNLCHG